jgi:glycosyltransferase involved in cell wall biosynthesis
MVIAGNKYLGNLSRQENSATFIVPTSLDMGRYKEKPDTQASNTIILGWIGSSATLFYLEERKDIWDSIHERFPETRLKIVADNFFQCRRMPVINKSWNYEEEIDDLHTFDIGLMPLTDDPWSRGKCGFKLLQYMAVGVPAVCSPVGVNEEIVSEGLNGFMARSGDEWVEKISILIEERKLRKQIGSAARESVKKHYSLERCSRKLVKLLNHAAKSENSPNHKKNQQIFDK